MAHPDPNSDFIRRGCSSPQRGQNLYKESFMAYETSGGDCNENHEQFVQRASRVFPSDSVRAWGRIERAVFNHLFEQLIRHRSYSEISNAMLYACRDDMNDIVHRLRSY